MSLITFLTDQTFDTSLPQPDRTGYHFQRAGRAVLTNDQDEIALMWVGKYGVFKLVQSTSSVEYDAKFMQKRDLSILKKVFTPHVQ